MIFYLWYNLDKGYPFEVICMYQVLLTEEIRKIENKTIQNRTITSFDLMKKAGKMIYENHKRFYPQKQNYLIICGIGHNGGDALVFGEQAVLDKNNVYAVVIRNSKELSKSLIAMINLYNDQGIPIAIIDNKTDFDRTIKQYKQIDTIIDGLFGIGLSRDVEGLYADVISWINHQNQQVISIDCPSGLHSDIGKIMNISVKADMTYTVETYKQGLLINDGLDCSKRIKVVEGIMDKIDFKKYLYQYQCTISKRKHNSHKYDYKSVITLGGQIGVMGALTLAGKSALVSGAGLSTVATKKEYQEHYVRSVPEIMYEIIENKEQLSDLLHKKDAILFGLGIKKITPFEEMIFDEVIKTKKPLILDAAGILLLKNKKKRNNQRTIITPHYGEFAKLMDVTADDISLDPIKYIDQCIKTFDCEIVLKGPTTIYATKEKILYLNEGTPALAKAGSGDVLAGIILTYAAQGLPIEEAISLHMIAGQLAKEHKHEASVLASDIIDQIPNVYKKKSI
jgi:NAD(P)H-hydrate epimerase